METGDQKAADKLSPKATRWIVGIVMAPFLLCGLGIFYGAVAGGDSAASDGYTAEYQCKEFVKDRLKAPASAEFETNHSGVDPTYTVTGTVDSQNSFGAMMRNPFTCRVSHDGDMWQLESLTGLGN